MEKFITVNGYELPDYLNKGYEILTRYEETYVQKHSLSGQLMGSNISVYDYPVAETVTKFVLKRSVQGDVLFGEKNENT